MRSTTVKESAAAEARLGIVHWSKPPELVGLPVADTKAAPTVGNESVTMTLVAAKSPLFSTFILNVACPPCTTLSAGAIRVLVTISSGWRR